MSETLQFTGERFTPECVREIWYEHYHRYAFARSLVSGSTVLDVACGEGYGSALLAEVAHSVTGVDIDAEAVRHAGERYRYENLEFLHGNCLELPFESHQFDRVVSFETLEHLEQHEQLMAEFQRVLKPDGLLVISSPDKAIYSERLGNDNEFHVRELYRAEFEALIGAYFPASIMWGQKLVFQSMIWHLSGGSDYEHHQVDESLITSGKPAYDPVYLIALCARSEDNLPDRSVALSLFDDASESVYQHYYHEIRKNMSAGVLLEEKEKEINSLKESLEQLSVPLPWWKRWFSKSQ